MEVLEKNEKKQSAAGEQSAPLKQEDPDSDSDLSSSPTLTPSQESRSGDKGDSLRAQARARDYRFEDWWKEYPKKVGKKDALKAWKARDLDHRADMLIADVVNRKQVDRKWQEGFVPNPATYLRGDRWEDEIQRGNGDGRRYESKRDRSDRELLESLERKKAGGILASDEGDLWPEMD